MTRLRIEGAGRLTRFGAARTANRHIERAVETEMVADPVRARDLGDSAQRLLESQAFLAALDDLRERASMDLMNSEPGPDGEKTRTIAHFRMTTLNDIEAKLVQMVEDAKFATAQEADKAGAENA